MTKVGLFYKEKNSKEVFEVVSVDGESIRINHTVENEAWVVTPELLSSEYTRLRGLKAQRAEILADVIKQIDLKFLNPTHEIYAQFKLKKAEEDDYNNDFYGASYVWLDDIKYSDLKNEQVNKFLHEKVESCEACAIGGLFLSAVDIHDKLKIKSLTDDNSMVKYLKEWFNNSELRLMEFAFEGVEFSNFTISKVEEVDDFRHELARKYPHYFQCPPEFILKEIIANTLKFDTFSPEKGLARKTLDEKKSA